MDAPDPLWMETEQAGGVPAWAWLVIAAFGVALTLAIVLPLVLS